MGLVGTIRYDIGNRTLPAHRTTPESVDCFELFSEMKASNCTDTLIEVSSHELIKSECILFKWTRSIPKSFRDHIDYHESLDAYFEVKKRLFTVS